MFGEGELGPSLLIGNAALPSAPVVTVSGICSEPVSSQSRTSTPAAGLPKRVAWNVPVTLSPAVPG